MKIYYGNDSCYRDVTFIYCSNYLRDLSIYIPASDEERMSKLGPDHLPGVEKQIIVIPNGKQPIVIPTGVSMLLTLNDEINDNIRNKLSLKPVVDDLLSVQSKLMSLHNSLKITYGSFMDELPEQLLAVEFIEKTDKILEIGANIGRNSIILSCLIESEKNQLVSLECNESFVSLLRHNRDINSLEFNIEPSALSERRLVIQDWQTMPLSVDEEIPSGFKEVRTISYDSLQEKYGIEFDTLVVDAEGALYYILLDNPKILKNIKKIIIENDYTDVNHYNYVQDLLIKNNFITIQTQQGGWGCCSDFFYQVWKKMI